MRLADVAQLVEQRFRKATVGGSNPPIGSQDMEKKRYLKLALLYSFLTLLLLGLIFKFGLKVAVVISEALQRSKPLPSGSLYENILPSPQFYPPIEATNSATLPILGYSQPNEKVDIYLNDLNVKTLEVDSEGKFEGFLSLSLGINKIYALTKTKDDQQSAPSQVWSVFFKDTPPSLEILEPENGRLIEKNPDIVIKGKSAVPAKLTVNDHQLVLDSEGNFSYPVRLQSGENQFKIVCTDPAQNKNEVEWTVKFQP